MTATREAMAGICKGEAVKTCSARACAPSAQGPRPSGARLQRRQCTAGAGGAGDDGGVEYRRYCRVAPRLAAASSGLVERERQQDFDERRVVIRVDKWTEGPSRAGREHPVDGA